MSLPATETMSPADYTLARNLMVDGQLRPSRVNDRRLLDIMRTLPRESYLPAGMATLAYIDEDVPLTPAPGRPQAHARYLLKPLILARMIQLARPREGETALVIGAGCGYGSAILAAFGVHVTALEEDAGLIGLARRNPAELVRLVEGPLAKGHPDGAPFDLVFIEGAVREIPPEIGRQVAANGRLVCILSPEGGTSVAVLAEPSTGGLRAQPEFDAAAPLLPGLQPAPGFVF